MHKSVRIARRGIWRAGMTRQKEARSRRRSINRSALGTAFRGKFVGVTVHQ
jgi:hypothetical protein